MDAPELGWLEVAASLTLVGLAVLVAGRQRLGLNRDILIASGRALVQLIAIGLVLLLIFDYGGVPGSLAWVVVMIVIAGQVAGRRGAGVPRGRYIATISVGAGSAAALALLLGLGIFPMQPSVIVPIGGMIVANAMQAVGLVLLRLVEHTEESRPAIEARLSLGMSTEEAFAPHRRSSARAALLPPIDATKVVGLISLPGAMTGLILAGVDPLLAIRYQIVVMYMMLGAAALAVALALFLAQRTLFDPAVRLRV